MKTIITVLAMCFTLGTAWAQDAKPADNKGEKKTGLYFVMTGDYEVDKNENLYDAERDLS